MQLHIIQEKSYLYIRVGKTVWYVDGEGVISLKIDEKEYGKGQKEDKPAVNLKEEIEIETSSNPMLQSWTSESITDFHAIEYKSKITRIKFTIIDKVPGNRIEEWDVSNEKDKSVMAWVEDDGNEGYILTIAGKEKIIANTDSSHLFYNFSKVKEIEKLELLDTSKVIKMWCMFASCQSLINIDVSKFNTNNVVDMNSMFFSCKNLKKLDLSNFDTSNVGNMNQMFHYCNSLEQLILSDNFKITEKVSFTNFMFGFCYNLIATINVIGKVSSTYSGMFKDASINSPAKIIVNYTAEASSTVDRMIATKSANSNVVKGVQLD